MSKDINEKSNSKFDKVNSPKEGSNEWYYEQIVKDYKENPNNRTFTISHVPLSQRAVVSRLLRENYGGNESDKKLGKSVHTLASTIPLAATVLSPIGGAAMRLGYKIARPIYKTSNKIYRRIPSKLRSGIDIGLTIDGIRNAFSDNGWRKTINYFQTDNYLKGALSGLQDTADTFGIAGLLRRGYRVIKPSVRTSLGTLELYNNIYKSKTPIVKEVFHGTTYLGNDFNKITNGGELGIHVGTDTSAPNYFLTNWKKMGRQGNPVIRHGYFIDYNGRTINTPDLGGWNASTIYKHALDKTSELHKRVPTSELQEPMRLYNAGYKNISQLPKLLKNEFDPNDSFLKIQMAAYKTSGLNVLEILNNHNIDAFKYKNDVENAGNISMAIFNPKRLLWAHEKFIEPSKRQTNFFGNTDLLSKFGDSKIPFIFYKKGGKLCKNQ